MPYPGGLQARLGRARRTQVGAAAHAGPPRNAPPDARSGGALSRRVVAALRPREAGMDQGLHDPRQDRAACGVGFVAHVRGRASHEIIEQGLELLENLAHRGAEGCDPDTGDGAGVLVQVPHAFFVREVAALGVTLPGRGRYAVGMFFLPRDVGTRQACELEVARVLGEEGCDVLAWRDVPVESASMGIIARDSAPVIRQAFITSKGATRNQKAFERQLYVARRQVENAVEGRGGFHVASLSSLTIVYKGMLKATQLRRFFPDLRDQAFTSAIALVHARFSTNTTPSWARAHPYRFICHNGEINTLRGNLNWMRVRESCVKSPLFGDEITKVFPIIEEDQSDTACLDNAVEFLVRGGRSLPHAMAMLIPEAWEGNAELDLDRRGFYEFHNAMMEAWDGPALVAFSDGRLVGGVLDRNGLRPARYVVTTDDRVVLASEAGALDIPPSMIVRKGRIRPGKMFLVDTGAGRVMEDEEIKGDLAARRPYRAWVTANRVGIEELPEPLALAQPDHVTLRERQAAFGYTGEELTMVLTAMATKGEEPVGSMGNDLPLAVLSHEPQLLFNYFKQLFAQVTNPPIDAIREQLVMSLSVNIGPRVNVLGERPVNARRIRVRSPILTNAQLAKIRAIVDPRFRCKVLPTLFAASGGPRGMHLALEALCRKAAQATREGHTIIVLSDRGVSESWAPIPSLLATAAVHHHLVREGLRTEVGLIVETGEAREVTHFALLIGYGAGTVNPYLAFESLVDLVRERRLPESIDEATAESKYIKAIEKGLLKILSKMGISTIQSYCGAQVFEALGLGPSLIERYFTGTASRIGGMEVLDVAAEALLRHGRAFSEQAGTRLDPGGRIHYRSQGEHHNWNPHTIATLQHAVRSNSHERYEAFARAVNDEAEHPSTIRGLMEFVERTPISLEAVEPSTRIVARFATGAMSFGSLSREAHETLAAAMNEIGGRSNSGEGGEEPRRYGTNRASAIKQVASGRFGVTTEYLLSAREIQIKMAQGAKPGEGGQLPGHKVDEVIARTRYATPGVSLISPPPHHDIYSIEDLAQLIFDLKNVNPRAMISVKLVSELGVGTIAAGVAKARADLILISGDSGGTGASPLSSIAHAGIPWEIGLADTQQSLVRNDLRGRVRLQTDGQLKTGRDVVVAALLGAEEFGFATAPLIAQGCIMMRQCHLNTCPVGIATQDPLLRARFQGQPEHVINYLFFVAGEVRRHMAQLGFRTMDEMIGRADMLRMRDLSAHPKARTLDLSALLHVPRVPEWVARRCIQPQQHPIDDVLDRTLIEAARPAFERGRRVHRRFPIRNADRTVGAMLSGEVVRQFGAHGLASGRLRFTFTGSAGQSFGAFCATGITLTVEGEVNDFFGKGLSGGRLVVMPPRDAAFPVEGTIAVGNVALYGATAGEAFIYGAAGERFAVRNSGAVAVVEGVGDHGCEYMTGGVVVVLGSTGRNFAAGMSGGVAFVVDTEGTFDQRCNKGLVEVTPIESPDDIALLKRLLERHARITGSARARRALRQWETTLGACVRVLPTEYRRVLEQQSREGVTHGRRERSVERPAGDAAAAGGRTDDGLARAVPA
ncbi:MAG: glutamate synthase large subunit [Cytophagaceae bacterium]|nr:glutamate synthase large subunit [Gemmatimonadaceae bacterium]